MTRTRMLLLTSTLIVAASCGAGHSSTDDRAIAIYSAAIRTVLVAPGARTSTTGPPKSVFVVAADEDKPISLEVQAGVADALHDVVGLRFVDERSEALDSTDTDKRVHDSGVLITLGTIPTGRDNVTVEVGRYEQSTVATTQRIQLHRTGSTWRP